jgi:hypothetical protein
MSSEFRNFRITLQKEYGVLSELKKDVESVLREGRRQVEDKKADSKLNTELDAIKALYNKVNGNSRSFLRTDPYFMFNYVCFQLGMQIASIRGSLEKGLTISSQMNDQMQSLEFWLQESETQTEEGFHDKESEMEFLRVINQSLCAK